MRYRVLYVHNPHLRGVEDHADILAATTFDNVADAARCADYWNNEHGCTPDDPDYIVIDQMTNRTITIVKVRA